MPSGWEVMDASPEWVEYHDEDGEIVRNQNNSADLFNGRMKGAADVGE
jgi:hypothetical protein